MEALDPQLTLWMVAGGVAGALSGLVPGLHVNTVAAGALVWAHRAPTQGPAPVVALLLAALGAATVTRVVPLVVLGVPEGADAPALLPGQRLARRGQAHRALTASVAGSVAATALACLAAWPLYHALVQPWTAQAVAALAPWVAGAALVALVATDPAGPLRALAVAALAGALGQVALSVALPGGAPLVATPLLPLFLGLYGAPALWHAARAPSPQEATAGQARAPGTVGGAGPVLGTGLGVVAGLFPGFTAGPATAVAATVRPARDEELLATTSAVDSAVAVVATVALHALGRTRTGVHVAQAALAGPSPGPHALLGDLALLTGGVAVGVVTVAFLRRRTGPLARRVPLVAAVLLPAWVLGVVWLTGWVGAWIAAAGWATARAGERAGTRRALLMAALLVPALLRGLPLG